MYINGRDNTDRTEIGGDSSAEVIRIRTTLSVIAQFATNQEILPKHDAI